MFEDKESIQLQFMLWHKHFPINFSPLFHLKSLDRHEQREHWWVSRSVSGGTRDPPVGPAPVSAEFQSSPVCSPPDNEV